MEGPTSRTALALLVLVLATTSETAVLKTTTGGTSPPSVEKTSEMVPSSTSTPGTVPSMTKPSGKVTKTSRTSPSSITTSGMAPNSIPTSRNVPVMVKVSEVAPNPTETSASLLRSSTKKPSINASPTVSTIAAHPEQPEAGFMPEPDTSSKLVSNGTFCPDGCKCEFGFALVILVNCSKDPNVPGETLENIFKEYQNTKELVIQYSHILYLPRSVCQLKNLEILTLDHNEIENVPWDCLQGMKKLIKINLSHNSITSVYDTMQFQSLQILLIDHNKLEDIDARAFRQIHNMKQLREINLQSNNLQTIDTWPLLGGHTRILLDNNRISTFTNNSGSSVKCNSGSRYMISLRNNAISHLTKMFHGWGFTDEEQDCFLNHSKTIHLEKNDFNCDCVDYDIYKSMQKYKDSFGGSAVCSKPRRFNGTKLENLPANEVACIVPKNCPDRCYCAKIPAQHAMMVNCTGLAWTQLPGLIPGLPDSSYSYILDLSRNQYESVEHSVPYFNVTQKAIFSYNIMTNFGKEALIGLENVTELHLDNNHLYYMPDKILGVVNFTDSLHMTLGENSWICDCYAKETKHWILKMGDRIVDKDRIICDDPPYAKGRHLLQMRDDELVCGFTPKPNYALYVGVGAATVAVWLVVIGIPTGILYANRLKLFRKFGWHIFNNDECYGEYKEFDIFLAYAEVNVDYAMEKLFVELENKGYIVAYHRINYMGGKPIKVNIEECIRKSKRTIIVLTKHFFTREWCRCEIMTALDIDKKQNTKRLIGILLEEVDDVPDLDEKVKKFIKTDHCLRLGEEYFEEKMEYMLARKKLKDQRERRPTREQLRARQQRRRQAAGNAPVAPAAVNARQPAAGAGALGPPHAPQRPAVLEHDRANLLDNEQ